MAFVFTDCKTDAFDLAQILKDPSKFPPEYVKDANAARQRMCEALLSQPSSQTLLKAIEIYFGYLIAIVETLDPKTIAKNTCKFSWSSVVSRGMRVSMNSQVYEKPVTRNPSVYFEVIETLLAYAFALANMAARILGTSLASASEEQCNEAADLFARSAGLFSYITKIWSCQWADRKKSPPECCPQFLTLLGVFMLAEANRVALAKAEKRTMSPNALVKLGASVLEGYNKCIELLASMPKAEVDEVVGAFISFIRDGAKIVEAGILRRMASIKHEEGENGIAVACLSAAIHDLKSVHNALWLPIKSEAESRIPECEETLTSIAQINNNITYQRVPEHDTAKFHIPAGRTIIDAKPFCPPKPHRPSPPVVGSPEPSSR